MNYYHCFWDETKSRFLQPVKNGRMGIIMKHNCRYSDLIEVKQIGGVKAFRCPICNKLFEPEISVLVPENFILDRKRLMFEWSKFL